MGIKYCYQRYASPAGDIFIVGYDRSIIFLSFGNITKMKMAGESPGYRKKKTIGIECVMEFLNGYFRNREISADIKIVFNVRKGVLQPKEHSFSAERTIFLDMQGYTQREITVYSELSRIGFGSTVSYRALAEKAGVPRGARFVGNAMAKNRFPLIIPCHRVIRSDSAIGNYSGGLSIKEYLLAHEARAVPATPTL